MESRKSSLAKVLVYRGIVIALLAAITWFYTGDLVETSAITIVYSIMATMVHYVLERLWKLKWKIRGSSSGTERNSR